LRKYYFFWKTYEIHLQKISLKQKMNRKQKFYNFFIKYYTIFNLYKFHFAIQLLNIVMIGIFFKELLIFNVFSILYFALIIVILTQPDFQKLWNSSLIFCLLPNLLVMFLNIFLYTTKIFDNNKFYNYLSNVNKFFIKNNP